MNNKGFTFIEVVCCMAIIALFTLGVVWAFSGLTGMGKKNEAIARATMIQTAKMIFADMKGSGGIIEFNGKGSDEERFALIKENIPACVHSSLSGITPRGFHFRLNKINEKVSIFYNSQEIRY